MYSIIQILTSDFADFFFFLILFTKCVGVLCGSPGALQHCAETVQTLCDRKVDAINVVANENHITDLLIKLQGGSNMTGTDLYVNKRHCAAAVRP